VSQNLRAIMRDHHLNPAEAVQALIDCGGELALAHHHGSSLPMNQLMPRSLHLLMP